MKKIFFIAILGTMFLTACNKATDSVTPNVEVTEAIKSSLRVAYPAATNVNYTAITLNSVEATFEVKKEQLIAGISSDAKILFTAKSINDATLPAVSLDYLTVNYPGYKLIRAGQKIDKAGAVTGYMADIEHNAKAYHIHFDGTGKFLTSDERNGKHKGKGVKVAQADLPAAIKTYLDTNYPAYKFDDALSFLLDSKNAGYGVRITTADGKEIGLMFDADGAFVRSREGDLGHHSGMGPGHDKGKDGKGGEGRGKNGATVVKIEKAALPAAILTYIDSKYAGYIYDSAKSFAKDAIVNLYEVEFTLGAKKYEVYFDAKGAFVKEKAK
jgi:hypothetical protein